ncbi:MAG: hypothetical protein MR550_05295 [Bacilli bacterium]|nr:hypothetical protein [Bacilli bacterium]
MKTTMEKIMIGLLVIFILLFVFVVIFVIANKKDNTVVEVPNNNLDATNYVLMEEVDTTKYMDLYSSVNLKKISFKNLTNESTKEFTDKQDEIIKSLEDSISVNKEFVNEYNKEHNVTGYKSTSKLESIMLTNINNNILSVLYLIEDEVDYKKVNNYIANLFVDTVSKNLLSSEEVLSKYGLSKEGISRRVFDLVIEGKDNKDELTKEADSYSSKIMDNFDKYIYLYFNSDGIYLKYNKSDISNYLFNSSLDSVKYSTYKIKGF